MIMMKYRPLLAAALFGALTFGIATPSLAHGDRYEPPGHGWGHHKHHHKHRHHHHRHGRDVVYYGAPVMVPQPAYYPAPYPYYPVRRDPAVVIGVDVPPLVIPLR